jgi:hypothetical protein
MSPCDTLLCLTTNWFFFVEYKTSKIVVRCSVVGVTLENPDLYSHPDVEFEFPLLQFSHRLEGANVIICRFLLIIYGTQLSREQNLRFSGKIEAIYTYKYSYAMKLCP